MASSRGGGSDRGESAAATPSGQVAWCVQVIDAVLRWDHQVSIGEQDGPMPATLSVSLNRIREILAPPSPLVQTLLDAMPIKQVPSEPHALVFDDGPVCWCGVNHNEDADCCSIGDPCPIHSPEAS